MPKVYSMSHAGFVWRYVRPQLFSVLVALVAALILGAVMAPLGPLVGPSIKVLTVSAQTSLALTDLFGVRLGTWVADVIARDSVYAGELVQVLPWLLVGVAAITATLGMLQWYLWERCGELASLKIRKDLVQSFLAMDPSVRRLDSARDRDADLSTSVTSDVRMLREYLVHFYGGLPRELSQTLFHTAMLILLSPKLFVIFAFGVAPTAVVLDRVGRKLRRRASKALADYSQLSEWLQQRLLGIETIKHFRTEQIEISKMHELTATLQERFLRAARVKARTSPLMEAFIAVAIVVVLVVALQDVAAGVIGGGVLMSFFTTLGLLSQSAAKLGRYLNSNREGAAAVERLQSVMNFLNQHQRGTIVPVIESNQVAHPSMFCEQVQVQYPNTLVPALDRISHLFDGGKIHCLAGPSGAGKSTLLQAALGLVRLADGNIFFRAPTTNDPRSLQIAYMPQKVQLAPDTVGANVAYPDADWDPARVWKALARVKMDAVVRELPAQIDTAVGEGGLGLSGGQAQRLLLARLCYHRAAFVFIDEGTSALDPEVEQLVHSLLRELADEGAVVVTVAHRRAVAEAADQLLLLDHGHIVASGRASNVLNSKAFQRVLQ